MKEKPEYHKDRKTISLIWDFSPYQAPGLKYSVKIKNKPILKINLIASPESWLRVLKRKKRAGSPFFDHVRFSDVKPFLSRPLKRSVEALKTLAEEDQDHFSAVFFNCVMLANSVNPLFRPARKARGGSSYMIDVAAMKTAARQLYVHLRLLKKHKPRGWRDKLSFIEKKYGVSCGDLRPAVMKIIQQEFEFRLDALPDSEGARIPNPIHFYKKFIYDEKKPGLLVRLQDSLRVKTGATPFIKKVFS